MLRFAAALLLLVCSAPLLSLAQSQRCHALTLGGGGDRGAYEAGAISGLVSCLPPSEVQYNVVAGISAGALNAVGFAQYPIGEERSASEFLLDQWLAIDRKSVWEDWKPGGVVQGFLLESGLLNSAPEFATVNKLVNDTALKNSGRKLTIGSTRLDTGEFVVFDQNDDDIFTAVMASSAIPGVFPTVRKNNLDFVDGGVNYMTPVTDAILDCKRRFPGIRNQDITVDVVLAIGAGNNTKPIGSKITTPWVLMRTLEDVVRNIFAKDIQSAGIAYPGVNIYSLQPSVPLPGDFLGFQYSKQMIQIGFGDAQNSTRCRNAGQEQQQQQQPAPVPVPEPEQASVSVRKRSHKIPPQ